MGGLAYAREVGQALRIETPSELHLVTVLSVSVGARKAMLRVSRQSRVEVAPVEVRTIDLPVDGVLRLDAESHVTLLEVRGGKARFNCEAPREVRIHRQEIVEAIERADVERAQQRSGPH